MKKGGMASGGMPMKDGKPAFIGDGKGAMKHGGMAKGGKTFDDNREPGSSGGGRGDRVGAPGGDDVTGTYKRGGMTHKDVKMDKGMMQKAVNKHEGRLHKGSPMTKLSKGGGVESKGKTKGKMVKMNMGGRPC
jgi:hypothetical protein